jgi:hypothetical protein
MPMPKQKPGRSKQDYSTPKDLLDAIKRWLGITAFEFDFACSMKNKKAKRGWTEKDDALAQTYHQWLAECRGGWGWLNPPFANIGPWALKCLIAKRAGTNIAFLVPASVGSNWYRDYIHGRSRVTVLFLNGRPSFDGKNGFPKDCMLVLFQGSVPYQEFQSDVWTWKETAK